MEELNEKVKDFVYQVLATSEDFKNEDSFTNDFIINRDFDYSSINYLKEDVPLLEQAITFILNISHEQRCELQTKARNYLSEKIKKVAEYIRNIISTDAPNNLEELDKRFSELKNEHSNYEEFDNVYIEEAINTVKKAYINGDWDYLFSTYSNPPLIYEDDIVFDTFYNNYVTLNEAIKRTSLDKYTLAPSPNNNGETRLYKIVGSRLDEDLNLYTAVRLVDKKYLIESEKVYIGKNVIIDDERQLIIFESPAELKKAYKEFEEHNVIFKFGSPNYVKWRFSAFDKLDNYKDHIEDAHTVINYFFYLNNNDEDLYLILNVLAFMYMNSDRNIVRYYNYVRDTMEIDFSLYDFSHYIYTHNNKGIITSAIKKLNNLNYPSSVYLVNYLVGLVSLSDADSRVESELVALEVIANNCFLIDDDDNHP